MPINATGGTGELVTSAQSHCPGPSSPAMIYLSLFTPRDRARLHPSFAVFHASGAIQARK